MLGHHRIPSMVLLKVNCIQGPQITVNPGPTTPSQTQQLTDLAIAAATESATNSYTTAPEYRARYIRQWFKDPL